MTLEAPPDTTVEKLLLIGLGLVGGGGFSVLAFALLIKYMSAAHRVLFRAQGEPDVPVGPEPAFKQYFFKKAWIDYGSIVRLSTRASWDMMDLVLAIYYRTESTPLFLFGQLVLIGSAAGICAGGAFLAMIGLVHLGMVLGCCAVAMALAYLCRMLEYGAMLWRRIFLVCPHAGCYRRFALPIYLCARCGVPHKQLIPGSYGTLRRRCQCGELLPTLFLVGRSRLPSKCPHPHCGRPLSHATGSARNLHFPVVGGPTAGKSSLLCAILNELAEQAAAGRIALAFPEKKDERLFAASREAFAGGQVVAKTAEYSPSAFLVQISDSDGRRALVHTYDAAGELYQSTDELHRQEYYSYLHGIMLVIDPYSLPQARDATGAASGALQAAMRPSSEAPEAVYERMVEALRGFSGQSGRLTHPLAIILTKADILAERTKLLPSGGAAEEEAASEAVVQWLKQHGAGNLVRTISKDFSEVRYFACSALGRSPEPSTRPFVPLFVLQPFAWLLGHHGLRIDAGQRGARLADQRPHRPAWVRPISSPLTEATQRKPARTDP